MSTIVGRIVAIARRDALIQVSYHFRLIFFFSGAFVSAFLAYYVSDLVSGSDALADFEGTYFDFVVIGIALTSYAGLGAEAFTGQMMSEQSAGTLEVLLGGDNRIGALLAGGFVVPLLMTSVEVALLVGFGVGVFGTGVSLGGALAAVPVVAVTVLNFSVLGIVSAALVLLVKRGDPISGPVYQVTLLMSGAIFPVELFPRWLELLCRATPGYYGVRGVREALLTDGGLTTTLDELAVLAAFAAVTIPVSAWLFRRSIATAKDLGVLGSY